MCDFTAENMSTEVAYNTTYIHEMGHQFGKDGSIAFPKTIAEWKEYKRLRRQK